MALDQEDKRLICMDLAQLCKYETEKAVSGSTADKDLKLFGSTLHSAYSFRENAERRARMLPGLVKGQSWYSDYEAIQKCIKQLDEYIRAQEVAQ